MVISCGCCDDPQSCEQLKKRVTNKYFEKNLDFECESPSVKGKMCYHYSSWASTNVYMTYFFDRNSEGKTSQNEWLFELNLRSFAYSKCSTVLWRPLDPPAAKATLLTRAGRFMPRLSPDTQNRAPAKNGSCIQIIDTALVNGMF